MDYAAINMLENRNQQISVNRVGGSTGTVSVDYTTSNGTAIAGSDYNAVSGTLSWADGDMLPKSFTVTTLPDTILDNNETFNITLSNPVGTTINGINTGTVTVTDLLPPISGTYTVGTGGNYSSLTNDSGIFQAINERVDGISGPLTINIISDLTAETGQHTLKEIAGNHAVLIKPSGVPRTITGTTSGSLLKFLDTDNITINGSTTAATVNGCTVGGNPAIRELTIQAFTSASDYSAVIHFKSNINGAKSNTIKNVNIIGSSSCYGIALSGNESMYSAYSSGTDNNGNRIENCSIKRARIGISSSGKNVDSPNIGTVITQNDLSSDIGFDKIKQTGVYLRNDTNPIISYNKVYVENYDSQDVAGLATGAVSANTQQITSGGITGAMINNNIITGARSVYSSGSTSAAGIIISGSYTGDPNIIQNNMISNISNQAKNPYVVAGIFVVGAVASNTKLYHNTISLSGNRGAESLQYPSYGIALSGLDPSVDIRNNIMTTTQIATGGGAVKTYAFGTASTTFDNLISDHNSFFSGGVQVGGFRSGSLANSAGTSYPTIAAWRTATSRDINSVQVAPVFVSATDLHLDAGSNPLIKSAGTPIATVATDIDCQLRNASNPTIGADEITTVTLGVNELNPTLNFSFYPNPVKSVLHIKNNSLINKVEVFTIMGQNVVSKTVNATSAECNLSTLPSGVYLVKITSGITIKSVKIIKE
nr:T9SS type A sorting domain-containing protein [uncultured Chryseobacterium sp.]